MDAHVAYGLVYIGVVCGGYTRQYLASTPMYMAATRTGSLCSIERSDSSTPETCSR